MGNILSKLVLTYCSYKLPIFLYRIAESYFFSFWVRNSNDLLLKNSNISFLRPEPINHFLFYVQVSISSVCRRHVLLLCWHDICGGGHFVSLQQNDVAVFHPTSS